MEVHVRHESKGVKGCFVCVGLSDVVGVKSVESSKIGSLKYFYEVLSNGDENDCKTLFHSF